MFMENLEKEWPTQRLREFALEKMRDSCKWALDKRAALELENKEARAKGVPYSERKKFTVKIEALNGLFQKWKRRGIYYNTHPVVLHEVVQPEDLDYIHSIRFERFLETALSW